MRKFVTDIFCGECKQSARYVHNGFNDSDNAHTVNERLSEDLTCTIYNKLADFVEIFTYDLEEIEKQKNE